MKTTVSLLIVCTLFLLMSACNGNPVDRTELSPEEQDLRDSISRARQKEVNDSLKKKNPLLILPPDSNYSGDYIDKYDNGLIKFRGTYRFGKRHGQWMSFYPNGMRWSEMHYDKGSRQGPNIAYQENGKIRYSGFYNQDKVDSLWCYYDSTGVLVEKLLYKSNRLLKRLPVK